MDPATATLLLNAAPKVIGFFEKRSAVRKRNKERLKIHERNKSKYINDFNRQIVAWNNDKVNSDIEVDSKWQEAMTKIASDDLKLWQGISSAGIAQQQAYAAMMSVGASEQTGRRSATTTNRRQAVLKYAGRMNEIASKLSFAKDTAALNRTSWAQEFTKFAQESHVKDIEGRPMPGHAPPPIPLEHKPDFLTGLVLPLVGEYFGYKELKSELDGPYSDEDLRGGMEKSPWGAGASGPESSGTDWRNPPELDLGSSSSDPGQIGDFFSKRSSNLASSQLGSSFLTSALNQA
tara:strand:+ start:1708 stop:2580 length:873 start_codon:yes stop_codon:yes gene_type:complete